MLARSLSLAAAVFVLLQSEPVMAAPPISDWKIEPSDARCVAVRTYGDPKKPMTLALKASASDNALQVAVLRTGYRTQFAQTWAKIEIDGDLIETSALSYPTAGNAKRVTHLINVDALPAAHLRMAKNLKVVVKDGVNEMFPLEPSIGVWRELQDCVARVRNVWNIGEENSKKIVKTAEGEIVLSGSDYPIPAILHDQQGTAGVLLLIDEKGTIRDCTVIGSSGSAALDSRSCGVIMVRSKFTPAIGVDGKPIKSSFEKRITWRMQ